MSMNDQSVYLGTAIDLYWGNLAAELFKMAEEMESVEPEDELSSITDDLFSSVL